MHLSPDFIDDLLYNNKDIPIVMPTRRASISTRRTSFTNTLARLLPATSSHLVNINTYPELYESQSSLRCLPGSSHGSKNKKNYQHCHVDDLMRTGSRSKGVRFAPMSEANFIMGLDDYSSEEIEACWYSKDELDRLHGDRRPEVVQTSPKIKSPEKKRRRFRRAHNLLRGDSRWSA